MQDVEFIGGELIYRLPFDGMRSVDAEGDVTGIYGGCSIDDKQFVENDNGDWTLYVLRHFCSDVEDPKLEIITSLSGVISRNEVFMPDFGSEARLQVLPSGQFLTFTNDVINLRDAGGASISALSWEYIDDIVETAVNDSGNIFIILEDQSVWRMEDGNSTPQYHIQLSFLPKKVLNLEGAFMAVTNDFVRALDDNLEMTLVQVDSPVAGGYIADACSDDDNLYFIQRTDDASMIWAYTVAEEFVLLHEENCDSIGFGSIDERGDHLFIGGSNSTVKSINKDPNFDDSIIRPEITVNYFDAHVAFQVDDDVTYRWQVDFTPSVEINDLTLRLSDDHEYNCGVKLILTDTTLAANVLHSFVGYKKIVPFDYPCDIPPAKLMIYGANYLPLCESVLIEVDPTILSVDEINVAAENTIRLHPNPTDGILQVDNGIFDLPYRICDLSGRVLKEQVFRDNRIKVSNLESGVYLFQQGQQAIRFVKL